MTRKKTPNVLGDLMGEEPEERQQSGKPANQQDSKASSRQAVRPAKRQAVKTLRQRLASEDKVKVTLYLSPETAYALDGAKLELRRLVKPDNLKDVTKSSITEAAIVLALQDLEAKGNKSALATELAKAVNRE
jgi:hypothetical protein